MTNTRSLPMLAACAALFMSAPALYAQSTVTLPGAIIASDLDNPRGLAISPNGSLYVVEAGRGGDGPCIPDPATQNVAVRCFGTTGALTEIDLKHGGTQELVTGLPSLAGNGGGDAIGPAHVSFQGNKAYVTIGWGGDPANRAKQLGSLGTVFGHTITVTPNGKWSLDVDVAAYEARTNPLALPDSDPFGIVAAPGRQIVADAGANAVFGIAANGTLTTLAVLPPRNVPPPFPGLPNPFPMESVPTAVALGPDGDLYIGQLTGFPFQVGGANVYRVHNGQLEQQPYLTGFTNIIDLEFDAAGNLYVLEIAKNGLLSGDPTGALYRVSPDGSSRTEIKVVDPNTQENLLVAPGGIAIGKDGALYITINTNQPFVGGVLRVQQ